MSLLKKTHPVLCAVDFAHNSLAAEKVALTCARLMKTDVTFCHSFFESHDLRNAALTGGFALPAETVDTLHKKVEEQKLQQLIWKVVAVGATATDKDVHCHIGFGDPVHEIKTHLKKDKPRLLVVSKRRRSFFSEFLLGSVGSRILRECVVNTLIVPDDEAIFVKWKPTRCVVALSFDAGSQHVWREASRFAKSIEASEVKILHVGLSWDGLLEIGKDNQKTGFGAEVRKVINEYETNLESKIDLFCKEMGIDRSNTEIEIRRGSVAAEMIESVENNRGDFLVVGANDGEKGHLKNLGSVASTIARAAKFPVLVIHT